MGFGEAVALRKIVSSVEDEICVVDVRSASVDGAARFRVGVDLHVGCRVRLAVCKTEQLCHREIAVCPADAAGKDVDSVCFARDVARQRDVEGAVRFPDDVCVQPLLRTGGCRLRGVGGVGGRCAENEVALVDRIDLIGDGRERVVLLDGDLDRRIFVRDAEFCCELASHVGDREQVSAHPVVVRGFYGKTLRVLFVLHVKVGISREGALDVRDGKICAGACAEQGLSSVRPDIPSVCRIVVLYVHVALVIACCDPELVLPGLRSDRLPDDLAPLEVERSARCPDPDRADLQGKGTLYAECFVLGVYRVESFAAVELSRRSADSPCLSVREPFDEELVYAVAAATRRVGRSSLDDDGRDGEIADVIVQVVLDLHVEIAVVPDHRHQHQVARIFDLVAGTVELRSALYEHLSVDVDPVVAVGLVQRRAADGRAGQFAEPLGQKIAFVQEVVRVSTLVPHLRDVPAEQRDVVYQIVRLFDHVANPVVQVETIVVVMLFHSITECGRHQSTQIGRASRRERV